MQRKTKSFSLLLRVAASKLFLTLLHTVHGVFRVDPVTDTCSQKARERRKGRGPIPFVPSS